MNVITIESEAFQEFIKKIDEMDQKISQIQNSSPSKETWLDVKETSRFLKISTRTLQSYRDQGLLPFSQIAAKIYFRYSDLVDFLMQHRTEKSFTNQSVAKGGAI